MPTSPPHLPLVEPPPRCPRNRAPQHSTPRKHKGYPAKGVAPPPPRAPGCLPVRPAPAPRTRIYVIRFVPTRSASQALAVSDQLPPHLSPLPQHSGNPHPLLMPHVGRCRQVHSHRLASHPTRQHPCQHPLARIPPSIQPSSFPAPHNSTHQQPRKRPSCRPRVPPKTLQYPLLQPKCRPPPSSPNQSLRHSIKARHKAPRLVGSPHTRPTRWVAQEVAGSHHTWLLAVVLAWCTCHRSLVQPGS